MARTMRRRPLLSRLFTTYLMLVVVVMFTGIGPSVPVSYAGDSGQIEVQGGGPPDPGATDELPPVEELPPSEESSANDENAVAPVSDQPEASGTGVEGDSSAPSNEDPAASPAGSDEGDSESNADGPMMLSLGGSAGLEAGGFGALSTSAEPPTGIHGIVPDWVDDSPPVPAPPGYQEFKIEGALLGNGTHDLGSGRSITISNYTGQQFDWSASGIEVYYVRVKGGPNANVYDYTHLGGVTSDTNLLSAIHPESGERTGISHIRFWYKVPIPQPAITIEKHTNGVDADTPTGPHVLVGDPVTWTYHVTSNVKLKNITVTDSDPAVVPVRVSGDTDADSCLDVGETWVYTASGTAVAGQYSNVGTATGTTKKGKSVSDTDPSHYFGADPDLTLLKEASPATYDAVGDVITYTYTLTNSGNVTLSGPFTVTDDKAATTRDGTVPDPDVLAPGGWITFSASYTITQDDLDAGSVTNVARGFGFFGEEKVESNIDDETVASVPDPELTLVKLASPATYDAVDDVITYTYTLTNSGNVTLTGPFSVSDDQVPVPPILPGPAMLAPGDSVTFTATHTITQADLDAGSITNTAQGFGFFGEDKVKSNYDDETVTAVQDPDLTLLKEASPATYDAVGDVITYTYTLTNSGNVTLSGPFTVTDDKAATTRDGTVPDPDVLAPGGWITFSASYTITQDDLDAGSVTNVAQGFGFFGEEKVESNIDDETVASVPDPAIDIEKLTNGQDGAFIPVGAEVTWSFVVTNTGNVTLSNVTVTDDKLGPIGTIGMLAPGAYQTFEVIGTAVAGLHENVGTATGTPPLGEAVEDVIDDDPSSYFGSQPAIDIEKTANPTLVIEGEEVTYTFVLTNTGNVDLFGVSVVDDHLGTIAEGLEMAPGEELTFTRTVPVTEPTTNVVIAEGWDRLEQRVTDSDEAFVDIDVPLPFPPDLIIDKTADRSAASPGDVITYTVVVENIGGEPASDFTVEDTFDQRYLIVVDAAGGTVTNGKITWTFAGPLAFGETQTITYKLKVAEEMPDGRTVLDNTVVVSHPDDEDPGNNTDTWRVTVNVEEPFLPFTGANLLGLLGMAALAAAAGAHLRRRAREIR